MNLILLIGCLIASYFDVKKRIIPNKLLLVMFLIGFLIAIIKYRLLEFLLVGIVTFLVLLPLFACNQIGAGDVKLIALIGAYIGPDILSIAIYFSITGAFIALCMLIVKRYMPWITDKGLPYAVPITIGLMIFTYNGGLI